MYIQFEVGEQVTVDWIRRPLKSDHIIPHFLADRKCVAHVFRPNLQSDDERDHDDAPREKTLEDVLPPVPTLSSYDFRPVDSLDSESEGEAEYHRKAQYASVLLLPSGCAR